MRQFLSGVITFCFAIGVIAVGCGKPPAEETVAEAVVSVRTQAVELRSFPDQIEISGKWRSGGEAIVVAPFLGYVESVSVRAGDLVRTGQIVCWLSTQESHAAIDGAELLALQARDEPSREEAARALRLARRDLIRVPLKAPRAGVVVRRAGEPGTRVSESSEILAIAPSDQVVFEAHVPAEFSSRLRRGQKAVVVATGAAPRSAALQRILPSAGEGDQAILVWLAPLGPGGGPPILDRFGSATLALGLPGRSAGVPDSAVVEDDVTGEKRVATVGTNGRATWILVTLGRRAGGWSELRPPALPVGTRVIVEGQHGLPDLSRVKSLP